ncbi:MAG TPA: cupin-like domain-containing protein [Candidatus Obscuribacterales bacterium]
MDKSWVAWTELNLQRGCDPNGILKILMKEQFEITAIRNVMGSRFPGQCVLAGNQSAAQADDTLPELVQKRESLVRIQRQLLALNPKAQSIERRRYLSRAEFLEQYYSANRPVVLCGLMDNWKAMQAWTPQYLKSVCGATEVEIQAGRNTTKLYEINDKPHRRQIRFDEYVDMVFNSQETNDFYLTARNEFFHRPGVDSLLRDIEMFPEYLQPNNNGDGLFFWFGPKGTVTPLHHDVQNIFMSQVIGRKHVKMIPSSELDLIYNHFSVYSQVDVENPDFERFPKFRQATVMDVDLDPGEVLFIPAGWWHHVRSLDASITISFTNFIFPNDYDSEWVHPSGNGALTAEPRYSAAPSEQPSNMPAAAVAQVDHKALHDNCMSLLLEHPKAKQIESPLVQLVTIDNFLSDEECDRLMDLVNDRLRPSTTTRETPGYRTSYTCDLSLVGDDFVKFIDCKIAAALGISPSHSEGIQAQTYDVGQEFKQHTDWFEPGTDEYRECAADRGNRTWTFMIYLMDTAKGGGTRFVNLDQTMFPKKGKAVVWNNLYADGTPNPDTLHCGMPVKKGKKAIITKWFRELGQGPMFA